MPRFEPFRALRYDTSTLAAEDVVAPPYDVVDPVLRAQLAATSPFNAIRVELPEPADGRDRYESAETLLRSWTAAGVLRLDDTPALYAYRLRYAAGDGMERTTRGVLGALQLEQPGAGDILPHEQTLPKARSDRLQLLRATRVNTSPVWGLSMAPGLGAATAAPGAPDMVAEVEGVRHELWRLEAGHASAVMSLIASAPIVLADGHHRFETALAYRRERREAGEGAGPWDFVLAFVSELAGEELQVGPIHRVLSGPPDLDIVGALGELFELEPAPSAEPAWLEARVASEGAPALVHGGMAWWLRWRAAAAEAPEDALDSRRLAGALERVSGVTVEYANGAAELERALAGSREAAERWGVVLRPLAVAAIESAARRRRRFPPKSTFFAPKPRTGMAFRPLL